MTMNATPVFPMTPNVGAATFIVAVTGANTAMDGTGTVSTLYTAGANGGFVDSIEVRHAGTNVATVARLFMNNGSTNATAANNILIGEITVAANTVSQTAASIPYSIPIKKNLPAGFKINMVLGTAVSAGLLAVPYGMDY